MQAGAKDPLAASTQDGTVSVRQSTGGGNGGDGVGGDGVGGNGVGGDGGLDGNRA